MTVPLNARRLKVRLTEMSAILDPTESRQPSRRGVKMAVAAADQ